MAHDPGTILLELLQSEVIIYLLLWLCTKNETMAPPLRATLYLVFRVPLYQEAPLHVATLAVQRELPKYAFRASTTKNETMWPHN